jgi:hypothetical protein
MLKAFFLFFILFILSSSSVFSVRELSIASDKSNLSLDQEMNISASISGFSDQEKIYLKGAFHKDDSTNYFGYTKNNDSWIKNSSSSTSQKEVTIGSWDNLLKVKVDYEDSGFIGVGDYKFKVGFYYITSGGNISSINWSLNSLDVKIENEPSPTSKSEVKSSNSTESIVIENTKTSTPTPYPSSFVTYAKKNDSKSVKITSEKKEASKYAQIKPIESISDEDKKEEVKVLGEKETSYPLIFLISGIFLILIGSLIFLRREIKERKIF